MTICARKNKKMEQKKRQKRIELIGKLLKTVNTREEHEELTIELAQLKEEEELNDIS